MLMQVETDEVNGELHYRLLALFRQPESNMPPIFNPKPSLQYAVLPR